MTRPHYQVRVHPENGAWVADLSEGDPDSDVLLFGESDTPAPDDPNLLISAQALIAQETGLMPGQYRLTILYAIPIQLQIGDSPLRTVGWVRRVDDESDMTALADLMRTLAREFSRMSADPAYIAPNTPQTGMSTPWSGP